MIVLIFKDFVFFQSNHLLKWQLLHIYVAVFFLCTKKHRLKKDGVRCILSFVQIFLFFYDYILACLSISVNKNSTVFLKKNSAIRSRFYFFTFTIICYHNGLILSIKKPSKKDGDKSLLLEMILFL